MRRVLLAVAVAAAVAGTFAARPAAAQGAWPVGAGATRTPPRDWPEERIASTRRTGADAVDALALLLAERTSLGLTTTQAVRVALVKARRDSVTRPLRATVDSLGVVGDATAWERLTDEQRVVLRGQMQLRSRTLLALREADQAARAAAYAELTETQQRQADSLEAAARRAAEDSLPTGRAGRLGGFTGKP